MRYFVLVLFALFALQAQAQSENRPQSANPEFVKETQVSEALPDGIAFSILVRQLAGIAADDREFAERLVQHNMGLSAERASSLLNELISASKQVNQDAFASMQQLYCAPTPHTRSNDELYGLFEKYSDLKDLVTARHFLLFKSRISPTEAARLDQYIANEKDNMGRAKVDLRKTYERTGGDPNEYIRDVCRAGLRAQP